MFLIIYLFAFLPYWLIYQSVALAFSGVVVAEFLHRSPLLSNVVLGSQVVFLLFALASSMAAVHKCRSRFRR